MRRLLLCLLSAVVLAVGAGDAFAAKRVALVIGNDDYQNLADLKKAVADARAYAGLLEGQGYQVTLRENADRFAMDSAIAAFIDSIEPGDTAVFTYSGHGWSDGTQNYMIGTDAPLSGTQEQLARLSIPLRNGATGVLDDMDRRGAAVKIAIVDACRDNPFRPTAQGRGVGLTRGLARVEPPEGTFLVFSAAPGQSALDGLGDDDPNPNSVFTRVFVPLAASGRSLQDAIKETQGQVVALARTLGQEQRPTYVDEMLGVTCLAGDCAQVALLTPAAGTPAGAPNPAADPEIAFWQSIQNSYNRADFEAYLKQFPNGVFAALAGNRLALLTPEAPAPVPPPPPAGGGVALTVTECDRLAASPTNPDNPPGVAGVASIGDNAKAAIDACEQAAAQYPDIRRFPYQLGRAYGAAMALDQAYAAYKRAADMGSAEAMRYVGFFHERGGAGLPQSDEEAFAWYTRAAEGGFATAMNDLGNSYAYGRGVPVDYAKAREWYERGAAGGDYYAMNNLGALYQDGNGGPPDYAKARDYYAQAVRQGYDVAMLNLGALYHFGIGVQVDYSAARGLYQQAVDLGYAPAMTNLGLLYERGQGVTRSYETALDWYRKAADSGDLQGMFNLANLYDDGLGVRVNHDEAAKLILETLNRGFGRGYETLRDQPETFSREVRVAVQSWLIREGYLAGAADGAFGARTLAALASARLARRK